MLSCCILNVIFVDLHQMTIPIVFIDVEYTGLLDTGCISTSIDPWVAEELGIAFGVLHDEQTILTIAKHTIPTCILTDGISLECNGKSTSCYVDDIEPDYFHNYIGMDQAERFGHDEKTSSQFGYCL
jgi:hypothetical protein